MQRLLLLLILFPFAFAQHDHSDGFVEEDAHVHGIANLQMVVDGDILLMDFTSPAINIVGFEYAPNDEAEVLAVENALRQLERIDGLIEPSAEAGCSLVEAHAEHTMMHSGHDHKPLFAEDGGVNADHPARHMRNGPMKSIIALANPEGNNEGLLYHAGGSHIRYDALMRGEVGYIEYHALEAGEYVFFLAQEADMLRLHDGMLHAPEMVVSGAMLHQEEPVFSKALVFGLEEGVHVFEVRSSLPSFSFVVEAQYHDDEHDHEGEHDEDHDHEGEYDEEHDREGEHDEDHNDAHDHGEEYEGAHADEVAHSHEGDMHDGHDHSEGAQHSEFVASYSFRCEKIDRLRGLELKNLFARYDGIEDLDVQYVLPSGQGATELNASATTLRF